MEKKIVDAGGEVPPAVDDKGGSDDENEEAPPPSAASPQRALAALLRAARTITKINEYFSSAWKVGSCLSGKYARPLP
eukprot:gene11516-biopygen4123